uniref:ATP-dependent RNA helicase n=1 Tax=Panagrolaimus davidi TaxID=227884 RepID=A0A914Q646_9BILA
MIEEVDPSQLVGLERKAFKRKATTEESEDGDEGDEEEVLAMPKKKQKKEKKLKELVEEEKEENSKKPAVGDKIIESSEDEDGDAEEKSGEPVKKGKKPGIKDPETANLDMSAWSQFILPPEVLEGLRKMRYTKPTPIQEMSLPAAMLKRQDLLGAAETGSGKTMAFCIPIATRLVENGVKDGLRALILAPTRELVVQIYKEMEKLLEFTQFSVIPVVGGLSQQKQERLLNRKPSVIVATPGRFWTLLEATDYLQDLSQLDFVVIDEIDRMVETGHFAEMEMILSKIHAIENKSRQTLVFSATLSFVHIPINRPGKNAMKLTKEEKIEKLVQIGGLRKQHKVIDLNESAGTPSSLIEARMNCSDLLDKVINI